MRIAGRALCLVLMGWLTACATGQRAGHHWELLGQRKVDFHIDHDVIEVGRSEGRFRVLRIVVRGGAIEMYDVKVVLGDGDSYRPSTRYIFDKGEGRTIDLPGDRRVVRRVEFVYRSLRAGRQHATVSLYGE